MCLTVNGEPRVDRANKPTSRAGTSPFKGDYLGLTPAVSMVPRANGSGWRWAINANDVPGRAFHGIFADNRNLVPPANPDDPALYAGLQTAVQHRRLRGKRRLAQYRRIRLTD